MHIIRTLIKVLTNQKKSLFFIKITQITPHPWKQEEYFEQRPILYMQKQELNILDNLSKMLIISPQISLKQDMQCYIFNQNPIKYDQNMRFLLVNIVLFTTPYLE